MIKRFAGSPHGDAYKAIQKAMGYYSFDYQEAQLIGPLAQEVLDGTMTVERAAKRGRAALHTLKWGK